jgi:acetylornithine/succinyldiaminopimelate/putrescine aminotransferase/predicted amino acid dehydrogenase/phosphohistidine swiveling domain-containing protein
MTTRSIPGLDSSSIVRLLELPVAEPGSYAAEALTAHVGRKAQSLADMMQHGLPVPEAFAVTTEAYRQMAAQPALAAAISAVIAMSGDRKAELELVRTLWLTLPLTDGVADSIRSAYQALGGGEVAVRSSGTAEDLANASFAGQYETYLGISGDDAVVHAVRQCWASAWADRVASYLDRKGISHDGLAMAVVVQRMVESEVSGVMFTIDPTSGVEEHVRIEACFGLGEALVSGRVTPDRFLVHRHSRQVLEAVVSRKELQMVRSPDGGVIEQVLDEVRGTERTLSDVQLAELVTLGRRVQAYYGCPQDVEWVLADGRISLVQSRPITTIAYDGVEGEWTTADFKDGGVSARVCSPYMWSLYDYIWQSSMPGYFRDIKLLRHNDPIVWGKVFYGRPYWNLGEVKRCLHLVPGFNERTFDADLGIEGLYEGDGVVIPVNPVTIAKALPTLFALTADYKKRIAHNKQFVAGFEALVARYEADPGTLDHKALTARYRRLVANDYFATESSYFYTIYNTSNSKLDFKVELDKANKQIGEPLSYLKLLGGLQGMRHLDPLKDLWAMAGQVRQRPELLQVIETTPATELVERLQAHVPDFWTELAAFLDHHRHHSVAELDITQPRWNEDPTFVMQTLKGYVAGYDPDRDPTVMNQRQHEIYQAEFRRAEQYFAQKGLLGIPAAKGFFGKLKLVRTYMWWREEMRDASSRMYALIRRETLAVARMLVAEGALHHAEDVWHLTWREVLAVMEGTMSPETARTLIADRQEDLSGYRHFTNPNELGRRFAIGRTASTVQADGSLVGTPCSPGVVTARVRLVPTIQDGERLQAGEILVTKFTDPGWTPLFSSIAGVITETGGILSHAAVISREYGIPAVLAVPNATKSLQDGQWVRLDGHAGTITPIDGPEGPGPDGGETKPAAAPVATVKAPPTATPTPATDSPSATGAFQQFARPEQVRVMKALGLDITYVRVEGDWMTYEADGKTKQVVDLLGGYGASLFGHYHPDLVSVMQRALTDRLPIQAQASVRHWAGELARELSERIGAQTGRSYVVTMTNSGAEAIEAGLKHAELERFEAASEAARRWKRRARSLMADAAHDQAAFLREVSRELGLPADIAVGDAFDAIAVANDRARNTQPVFLALERAFHGKTSGASQVTYNPDYREPFSRIGVRCEFLPANDERAWERAIARATIRTWDVANDKGQLILVEKPWVNVSAILVEPIQGEGGIHPLSNEDAARIRILADTHQLPIIVDEIQAGMGRAGSFLASTACGLRGDYYTFAKSLGGGLTKIGALAIDSARYRATFGLKHTSTFAEDDLSCRVAVEALALLDREDIPARCQKLGEHFLAGLRPIVERHPRVLLDVRGRGLMLGLEFRSQEHNPSNVIRMLSDQGFLGYAIAGYLLHEEGFRVAPTLSATTTIRLEPSAFIDVEHLDRFVAAIDRLCTILERGNAYRLTRYMVGLAQPGDETPIQDFTDSGRRFRREEPRCDKRVAFISHFIAARDAVHWDPSLAGLPKGAVDHYQLAAHRILGPARYDQMHVTSALGETVHFRVYGLNLTSKSMAAAMRSRDTDWIVKMIEEAAARAREDGCQVIGLGGYTSIVTDNGRRLTERGVAITTGNSLTVGMGLAGIRQAAAEQGIDVTTASLGVIGAAGNIGSVYARMMAETVAKLVLIGTGVSTRLEQVAWQIYDDALGRIASGEPVAGVAAVIAGTQAVRDALPGAGDRRDDAAVAAFGRAVHAELGDQAPIVLTEDLSRLQDCRLIVTASNSATPIIQPHHLGRESAVICDISVPDDVAEAVVTERPDVVVLRGGLVAIPNDPEFRVGGMILPEGYSYACLAETLLLGLMGVRDNFSYGPILPEKVRQVMTWAEINGFRLAMDRRLPAK